MNKRKVWLWIVGGLVLITTVIVVGGLGLLGRLPWQRGIHHTIQDSSILAIARFIVSSMTFRVVNAISRLISLM
jgi:hypothetical protein